MTFRTQTFVALGGVVLLLSGSFLCGMELVLERELRATLQAELDGTVAAFRIQMEDASERLRTEGRVVAEEPRLKAALNTPGLSQATLDDIADELRRTVRWDVLALADSDGVLRSVQGTQPRGDLQDVFSSDGDGTARFWTDGGEVYQVAAVPLTFGETRLGVLTAGYAISDLTVSALKRIIGSDVAIYAGQHLVASTFEPGSAHRAGLPSIPGRLGGRLALGPDWFLARSVRLSGGVEGLILRSEDAVLAPYRRLRRAFTAISIAVLALAAAAAVLLVRRTETRFRQFIESAPEAILVLRDGRIVHANPSFLASLGYTRSEELEGKGVVDLAHPGDAPQLAGCGRASSAMRDGPSLQEVRLRGRQGTERTFDIVALAAEFEGAHCDFLFGRDVTERKETQAKLLVADRMASVGTLASGVAHEINNPLAYVIANLDVLQKAIETGGEGTPAGDSEAAQVLGDAREGAERVRRIVRDLKSFSRADEDKRGPVDVHRVLESSINISWNEIRHRARLVKDYASVPLVEANESRLAQVFVNLLLNAAQAIGEGNADNEEIRVVTRTDPAGRAIVEICDTGTGIPEQILGRIFDPFFTTKPIGCGTGLGLSICHGIVQRFGGQISVDTRLGMGSVFRLTLPAATTSPDDREPAAALVPTGKRGSILVVDDEVLIGVALRRLLSAEHDVEALTCGRKALARISAGERFDVLLCDLLMPQMTGMDLYEALRRIAPDQAERTIFLTGGAFTPRARAFIDSVPNRFLEKPLQPQQLFALIRSRVG